MIDTYSTLHYGINSLTLLTLGFVSFGSVRFAIKEVSLVIVLRMMLITLMQNELHTSLGRFRDIRLVCFGAKAEVS